MYWDFKEDIKIKGESKCQPVNLKDCRLVKDTIVNTELWQTTVKMKHKRLMQKIDGEWKHRAKDFHRSCCALFHKKPEGINPKMQAFWKKQGPYSFYKLLSIIDKYIDLAEMDFNNLWCGVYHGYEPQRLKGLSRDEMEELYPDKPQRREAREQKDVLPVGECYWGMCKVKEGGDPAQNSIDYQYYKHGAGRSVLAGMIL